MCNTQNIGNGQYFLFRRTNAAIHDVVELLMRYAVLLAQSTNINSARLFEAFKQASVVIFVGRQTGNGSSAPYRRRGFRN